MSGANARHAQSSSQSRLDRLLKLLEGGSSAEVREVAAQQIGDLYQQRPTQLQKLLLKLQRYLYSNRWESRIAAASAIGAVCRHVKSYDDADVELPMFRCKFSGGDLLLNREVCDMERFVSHTEPLTGSTGEEFDILGSAYAGAERSKRLEKHRKYVRQWMGTEAVDENQSTGIDDADLLDDGAPAPQKDMDAMDRFRLKQLQRKRKRSDDTVTSSRSKKTKVAADGSEGEMPADDVDECPPLVWKLDGFVDGLRTDLFHSKWEIRHGAALALREIVRAERERMHLLKEWKTFARHPYGADGEYTGDIVDMLMDLCIRCLILLSADRFNDYIGDRVISPVRETSGQLLGILVDVFPAECEHSNELFTFVLRKLKVMLEYSAGVHWEPQHGALLGYKYIIAVRPERVLPIFTESLFTEVHKLIAESAEDDVRTSAVDVVLSFLQSSRLGSKCNESVLAVMSADASFASFVSTLWCVLDRVDDLCSSSASVIELLGVLYSRCDLKRLPAARIRLLYPFFRHHIRSVRSSVLNTLTVLLKDPAVVCALCEGLLSGGSEDGNEVNAAVQLVVLSYQNMLMEADDGVARSAYEFFVLLTKIFEPKWLDDCAGSRWCAAWLALICGPPRQKLDEESRNMLQYPRLAAARSSVGASTLDSNGRAGRSENMVDVHGRMTMGDDEREAMDIRMICIDALSHLWVRVSPNGAVSKIMDEFVAFSLGDSGTPSIYRIIVTASFVVNCVDRLKDASTSPVKERFSSLRRWQSLLTDCFKRMSDPKHERALREVQPYSVRLQKAITSFLGAIERHNFSYDYFHSRLTVHHVHSVSNMCASGVTTVFTSEYESWVQSPQTPKSIADHASQERDGVLNAVRDQSMIQSLLGSRIKSALCHAMVRVGTLAVPDGVDAVSLPAKMGGVVQCLIQNLKTESCCTVVHTRTAESLALLIRFYREGGKAGLSDKLVKNVFQILATAATSAHVAAAATLWYTEPESVMDMDWSCTEFKKSQDALGGHVYTSLHGFQDCFCNVPSWAMSNSMVGLFPDRFPNGTRDETAPLALRGCSLAIRSLCHLYQNHMDETFCEILCPLQQECTPDFNTLATSFSLVAMIAPYLQTCMVESMITGCSVKSSMLHMAVECACFKSGMTAVTNDPKEIVMLALLAGDALVGLAAHHTPAVMPFIIDKLLPIVEDEDSYMALQTPLECSGADVSRLSCRLGAMCVIYHLLQRVEPTTMLPYIVFWVLPSMSCMTAQASMTRAYGSRSFAYMVRAMSLEEGIPDPPGMSADLVASRQRERRFLQQLLGEGQTMEDFELPLKFNAELRQYQKAGVNWLNFLRSYHLHGILADDMGLGKTLQTLCMVVSHHFEVVSTGKNKAPISLVICPPSVVGHWYHEVLKFVPKEHLDIVKPLQYIGPPKDRLPLRKMIEPYVVAHAVREEGVKAELTAEGETPAGGCLVVVSYEVVRSEIEFFSQFKFDYCVLDEGHCIRNHKSELSRSVKRLRAKHRLLLSGTPVQNHVLELWSLFDFLMPGYLGSRKEFDQQYSRPILASRKESVTKPASKKKDSASQEKEEQLTIFEKGTIALEKLHKLVLPFVMRRMKEYVLKDLPPKTIQDVHCELTPIQKTLYEQFSSSDVKRELEDSVDTKKRDGGAPKHVFEALQYLRKLCSHPVLAKPSDELKKALMKKNIRADDYKSSAKMTALSDLLEECGLKSAAKGTSSSGGGDEDVDDEDIDEEDASFHRILIFAQLKSTLDVIENQLLKLHFPGVRYSRLDGGVPVHERHGVVHRFNCDPTCRIMLLTTHVGGLGLNLTGADTVIFYEHDWNPMKDLQAMDRAHRIGQKKCVNVYRLISSGTLEEKIMGLQQFKLAVAGAIVNKDNQSLSSMQTEKLVDMMEAEATASSSKASTSKSTTDEDKIPGGLGAGIGGLAQFASDAYDDSGSYEEYNTDAFVKSLGNLKN